MTSSITDQLIFNPRITADQLLGLKERKYFFSPRAMAPYTSGTVVIVEERRETRVCQNISL